MCSYRALLIFALLLCPLAASAQTRAAVLADAPIYLQPGDVNPLRPAAANTELIVLAEEGPWVRVIFLDPDAGRRKGYIEARFLRILRDAETTPLDLSVPTTDSGAPVRAVAQTPAPPAERPLTRSGVWFSAGLGYGSLGCETCFGRVDGTSGGIAVGWTMNDRAHTVAAPI